MAKRSKANLSHKILCSLEFGRLTPVLCEDVLPGDTFKLSSEVFIKAIPLLAPIMDEVDVRMDYFFVPNRILWEDWPKFITGQQLSQTGGVSQDVNNISAPRLIYNPGYEGYEDVLYLASWYANHLYQFGTDQIGQGGFTVDALPLMAYQKIYYDWYADQRVEALNALSPDGEEVPFSYIRHDDVNPDGTIKQYPFGQDDIRWSNLLIPKYRAYQRDYFTQANPWPQHGPEVGVDIPSSDMQPGNTISAGELGSITIPELRRLNALQKWFERNARWGSRYIEQIFSHFGVRTPDYRLQRSEYLGGTVQPLNVSETFQTATPTESTQETESVLGQYAGHLSSYGVNGVRKYTSQEHGWIIGILSVVPKTSYGQGIQRRFQRFSRLDYAWPEFAGIGEQPIYDRELYLGSRDSEFLPDTTAGNFYNRIFGFVPRFYEYFHRTNRFDSSFRKVFPYWHLGRIFTAHPNLNSTFLYPQTANTNRIFAYNPDEFEVGSETEETGHLLCQINHSILCRRKIPKSIPNL